MTSYPGTIMTRILGRHYDRVSWDAIMNSYPGRHYDLVSWDAIMTEYSGTPL